MNIQLGHPETSAPDNLLQIFCTTIAENVSAATDGAVKIDVFGDGVLGPEPDMLEGLVIGTMDMAVITNAMISSLAPSAQVSELPFVYPNYEVAAQFLDDPVWDTVEADVEANVNAKLLGYAFTGFRQTYNNVRPISSAADFKGIKIRVMPTPVFFDSFGLLGANPTPMAYSELLTALQQGTVDAMEGPITSTYSGQFYKVIKYCDLTNHTLNTNGVLVNLELWNSFSPELQEIFTEAVQDAIAKERQMLMEVEDQVLGEIEAFGVAVNRDVDTLSMQTVVRSMYQVYREKSGPEHFDACMELLAELSGAQ
jgi:tripartite ATP-independent transporter DctP family solute receptor